MKKSIESVEKDVIYSPRRKKQKFHEENLVVHETISSADFKKHCDEAILHYGKPRRQHNRKHLEKILEVGYVNNIQNEIGGGGV